MKMKRKFNVDFFKKLIRPTSEERVKSIPVCFMCTTIFTVPTIDNVIYFLFRCERYCIEKKKN